MQCTTNYACWKSLNCKFKRKLLLQYDARYSTSTVSISTYRPVYRTLLMSSSRNMRQCQYNKGRVRSVLGNRIHTDVVIRSSPGRAFFCFMQPPCRCFTLNKELQ
jgi:hypothetical protein